MEEIWKDIKGYEGLYQVSNLGRIKSLAREYSVNKGKRYIGERIKNLRKDSRGHYLLVDLSKNGKSKTLLVHRIVAEHFINNPNNLTQVNHKDEDKTNNNVENLEWCDGKYNQNYGTLPKRRNEKLKHIKHEKKVICIEDKIIFNSIKEAGKYYNIETGNISRVCSKKRKSVGGKTFKYV